MTTPTLFALDGHTFTSHCFFSPACDHVETDHDMQVAARLMNDHYDQHHAVELDGMLGARGRGYRNV